MTERVFLAVAGLFGAISVGADAAARHLLGGDALRLDLAQTSARYGLFHAAALVGIVALIGRARSRHSNPARATGNAQAAVGRAQRLWLAAAGWCFVAGLVLFSASLDVLAAGAPPMLAALVPWGGTAFIAGWLALLVAALVPGSIA